MGFEYFLPWLNEEPDPRWRPLNNLLQEAYERYGRPLILSETSHPGEDRPKWITFVAGQCQMVLNKGIPFYGICLYPIIDRPDWDDLGYWHHSGLWDCAEERNESASRIINNSYADALRTAQRTLAPFGENVGSS